MIKHNKLYACLLLLVLIFNYQYADSNQRDSSAQQHGFITSWHDWARIVRIDPVRVEQVPDLQHDCNPNSSSHSGIVSPGSDNFLGISDAVRYHLEQAEGRSYSSSRKLTPKQRYQRQRSRQSIYPDYLDCINNYLKRTHQIRYYRICYVYRGREYYSTLDYYPRSPIRVHVTAIPLNQGYPPEYKYEVIPADLKY